MLVKSSFGRCEGPCRKTLPGSEFHDDQVLCKKCFNSDRKFGRLAEKQSQSEWLHDLKAEQPKVLASLQRKFMKHCDENSANTFSVLEHKRRIIARRGSRGSNRKKWTWEEEFIEKMQSVEMGKYTASEARKMWKEKMVNPKYKRNTRGPRGTLQIKVPIGQYESDFSEMASEDAVSHICSTAKKKQSAPIKTKQKQTVNTLRRMNGRQGRRPRRSRRRRTCRKHWLGLATVIEALPFSMRPTTTPVLTAATPTTGRTTGSRGGENILRWVQT